MSLESKEVFMNGLDYIELESNGTALYVNGMTYPINEDGTHDTYDGMGVHIQDCSTEWWSYMSMEDALIVFPFLAERFAGYHTEGYMKWAVEMFSIVEENSDEYSGLDYDWMAS